MLELRNLTFLLPANPTCMTMEGHTDNSVVISFHMIFDGELRLNALRHKQTKSLSTCIKAFVKSKLYSRKCVDLVQICMQSLHKNVLCFSTKHLNKFLITRLDVV